MLHRNELFEMIKTKSFKYSEDPPFTLASGRKSPFYFDCRQTLLNPNGFKWAGVEFSNAIIALKQSGGKEFSHIGGLTMGADPITYSVCHNMEFMAPLIIRKEPKDHGTGKQIEGIFKEGDLAIAVDDVITTGGSTIKAINAMRKEGIIVDTAIILLDREEGGREAIEELDIEVISLFKASDFKED